MKKEISACIFDRTVLFGMSTNQLERIYVFFHFINYVFLSHYIYDHLNYIVVVVI